MSHEPIKRPLLFDVQCVKNAPIALVNNQEAKKITRRHAERLERDDGETRAAELPTSALPMIRSRRPEKPVYVPSPTKTPSYFRWKAKPQQAGSNASPGQRPSAPYASRHGPRAPSPRLSAVVMPGRPSGLPAPQESPWSRGDLQRVGPSLFEVASGDGESCGQRPPNAFPPLPSTPSDSLTTSRVSTAAKPSDLFDYDNMPMTPSTSGSTRQTSVAALPAVTGYSPLATAPSTGLVESVVNVATPEPQASPPQTAAVAVPSSSSATSPPIELKRPPTPKLLDSPADEPTADDERDDSDRDGKDDEPARVAIEFSGGGGGGDARQPQEKVIAQHVLRGKFLRKYLHANNLTRKLKETEQALRSAALAGGIPTMKGGGSLFSRSFLTKAAASAASGQPATPPTAKTLVHELLGEEATAMLNEQLPVLRRLSSIDKAINNTARRIRRMSGIDDPGAKQLPSQQVPTTATPEKASGRRFTPLKPIGEKQPVAFAGLPKDEDEGDAADGGAFGMDEDGDDGSDLPGGAKIDPSSAHMMRICQHVIAKRAIKAFLRQEMSVITIIEVALRDDTQLMPKWLQFASHSTGHLVHRQQRSPSPDSSSSSGGDATAANAEPHRVPIKAMRADILEAATGYLKEGDQHFCLEELYAAAMRAERDKLWKRAILLASVCVVLDREFLHGVLLRARCCRRLGLWTQAVKDLGHAVLLRPDEYKLVLLRACLYVKMGDLENALADANRALAMFPKCVDALLLRAEIFHRQNAIGASLQDLTTALLYDPGCWRAFYDRATIRIRAIEGDESSLSYHWEHMKYEKLLASIIEDYVSAVRRGCQMVEVVETIGDLSVRLLEFTGDANVLRQVVNNLTHLLQILAHDHRRSFHTAAANAAAAATHGRSPSIVHATATVAAAAATATNGANSSAAMGGGGGGLEQLRSSELARELLVASIHAQRGRLLVLLQDKAAALADFDQAVVTEYHYPVAHFYRGAFATLTAAAAVVTTTTTTPRRGSTSVASDDPLAVAATRQHLNRCISLDPTIAGAYTVRGALHLRDLKFNSALQDLKAAVATDPTLYEVWLQIALIYLNHYHDSEECIRACSHALANDSSLARALYLRAEAFTRQGNVRAALRDYGRLTIATPDDRWAQLMRGRLLLQLKLARPALYAFIQFMELGAADKRAHLLCGRAYKILTRFQQAVDQFQRAVALHPTSDNLMLLSESLHSMGDTENSLRVSEKVIHADPGSARGYVRRAQLLVSTGELQRALSEYSTALALAPKDGRVVYERGIVQMQLFLRWRVAFQLNFEDADTTTRRRRSPFEPRIPAIDVEATLGADQINDEKTVVASMGALYAGALADFSRSMRLEPLRSEPYVDRAELFILGEDYAKAFADFHAAIARNPKCVRALVNLGVLKCQFAAFAAAIADFDRAVRCEPALALAFFNRGVCYQKLELWRQADASYSRCIALAGVGRDVDAHRNRAIARCHTGAAFADALADLEEVRQSAPDDDQLHGGLGYVLLQLGRYEDAARCFATYGRLNRDTFADSGNAFLNLASSGGHLDQAKHGAYLERALRLYLRAARLHPSNLDLRLNIANCLRRMDEPRRAVSQCDAIAAARPTHHACLESKALCFYQMHRLPEAVEWMNAAIRACVASSSALENIFYAFAHASIHRHALERKTVGQAQPPSTRGDSSPERTPSETMAQAMSAQLQQLKQRRVLPDGDGSDGRDGSEPRPAASTSSAAAPSGVVLTGSSKQMLALYMMNRGILYEKMGAWGDAARDYKDAVHFDPLSVQPLLCLATLLLLQRRLDESRDAFQRALALEPANGLAHLNLGVVLLCADDLDGALRHFDEAAAALPTCSYAYANRAVALARKGELPRAERELKRAIEELPSRQEYYLARGKIIAQQKRLQDAMVDFSTALFLGYEGKL